MKAYGLNARKARILSGFKAVRKGSKAAKVSITKRYNVRIYDTSGKLISQMTDRRADAYANGEVFD